MIYSNRLTDINRTLAAIANCITVISTILRQFRLSVQFWLSVLLDQGIKVRSTWTSFRLHHLELYARLGHRPEWGGLPVGLGVLFPHDGVELVVVLTRKDRSAVLSTQIENRLKLIILLLYFIKFFLRKAFM